MESWQFCHSSLVALLIIPLHKMKAEQVKAAWKETGQMVGGAAIALMFGIAMVQLFRNSGAQFNHSGMDSMLIVMANGMADLFGKAYIVVSPLIGVIGAFISGSATVSNTLFSTLQFAAAIRLGLPAMLIVAMQVMAVPWQHGLRQQYRFSMCNLWYSRN